MRIQSRVYYTYHKVEIVELPNRTRGIACEFIALGVEPVGFLTFETVEETRNFLLIIQGRQIINLIAPGGIEIHFIPDEEPAQGVQKLIADLQRAVINLTLVDKLVATDNSLTPDEQTRLIEMINTLGATNE